MPEIVIRISVPDGSTVAVEGITPAAQSDGLDAEVLTRIKRARQSSWAECEEIWARWAIEKCRVSIEPGRGKTGPYGRVNVYAPPGQKRRRIAGLTTPSARLWFPLDHSHADGTIVTKVFLKNRTDPTQADRPAGVAVRLHSPEQVEAAKSLLEAVLAI